MPRFCISHSECLLFDRYLALQLMKTVTLVHQLAHLILLTLTLIRKITTGLSIQQMGCSASIQTFLRLVFYCNVTIRSLQTIDCWHRK